jgi:hypothetical protein
MHDKYKPSRPIDRSWGLQPPWEDPFLKHLNDLIEADARKNEYIDASRTWLRRISEELQDLHEQRLFQNLMPEFDRVPMKRAFLACVYSPRKEEGLLGPTLESQFVAVIESSGAELVWQYPPLTGSRLYRCTLQTTHRQTRKEFENSYGCAGEELAQCLQEEQCRNITLVSNIHIGSPEGDKEHRRDCTEKLKDLTEALKNLVLIGAGICFMIDGTLVKTADSNSQPREVSVLKVPRDEELKFLPKILEATTPQEFREGVESIKRESLHGKKHKPIRKFRVNE